MRRVLGKKRLAIAGAVCALASGSALSAEAATTRSCDPVVNPYPDTKFEGVDLTEIRATKVWCSRARAVARGAHRKALGITPPSSGVRRFTWHGWRVTGDLRGNTDSYVASRGIKRVRWKF